MQSCLGLKFSPRLFSSPKNVAEPDYWHQHTFWRFYKEDRKYQYLEERGQDQFMRDAVSQTSKPALLVVTDGEGKASILDKLKNHSGLVLIAS